MIEALKSKLFIEFSEKQFVFLDTVYFDEGVENFQEEEIQLFQVQLKKLKDMILGYQSFNCQDIQNLQNQN